MGDHSGAAEDAALTDPFNRRIALAVALMSAFMAVANIKSDNVSQTYEAARLAAVNAWSQYQTKRIRQFTLEVAIAGAEIDAGAPPTRERTIAHWRSEMARYERELDEISAEARRHEAVAAEAASRDELFSLSDTFLTIGLALFAVTALTGVRWLFFGALASGLVGILFGLGGFGGWIALRPGWLVSLIS
jgi:hypothetical protein